MVEDLTDSQVMDQLASLANTATVETEKHNAHTFLTKVVEEKDTTKLGFLKEEEVGIPKLSMRTLKELALYAKDIGDEEEWANYFNKRAEILTSTSLSKNAKLIDLAITQTRNVANVTPQPRKINKSWFGQKKAPTPEV